MRVYYYRRGSAASKMAPTPSTLTTCGEQPSSTSSKEFIEEVLPLIDLLFLGDHEARALWGRDDAEFVRELCDRQGSQEVVHKRGKHGRCADAVLAGAGKVPALC